MPLENIDQLISQFKLLRSVGDLEAFRRTHTAAINAILHQRFGENISLNSIIKWFRDNGYLLDRVIAENMSEAARADKIERTKNALTQKRKALRAISSF